MKKPKPLPLFLALVLISLLPSRVLIAYTRIVSLKPNITEILFALGAGDRIVGVTSYCDRPPEAQKLPKVADYIHVDTEKTLLLKPDLILGSTENASQKEVNFLESRGVKVALFPFATLKDLMSSLAAIGKLLDAAPEADRILATMRSELEDLKARAKDRPRLKALFVVGADPLVVAGSGNFFDDAAEYLAVTNVAGQSRLHYPTFSTEALIRSAPEVILELTMGSEQSASREERRRWWARFGSIPAVKNGRVYFMDIERMRAVPGLPSFLGDIFLILHGEKK